MRRATSSFLGVFILSPGIANDMGGITLIPISINLGQPCKVDEQASCHPPGNQAQEVQLPAASKPKRTGSLALFYRKVSVLAQEWCCTCAHSHAGSASLCSSHYLQSSCAFPFAHAVLRYLEEEGKRCWVLQSVQFSPFYSQYFFFLFT